MVGEIRAPAEHLSCTTTIQLLEREILMPLDLGQSSLERMPTIPHILWVREGYTGLAKTITSRRKAVKWMRDYCGGESNYKSPKNSHDPFEPKYVAEVGWSNHYLWDVHHPAWKQFGKTSESVRTLFKMLGMYTELNWDMWTPTQDELQDIRRIIEFLELDYDLEEYDQMVEALHSNGLRAYLTLAVFLCPEFAYNDEDSPGYMARYGAPREALIHIIENGDEDEAPDERWITNLKRVVGPPKPKTTLKTAMQRNARVVGEVDIFQLEALRRLLEGANTGFEVTGIETETTTLTVGERTVPLHPILALDGEEEVEEEDEEGTLEE